MVTEHAVPAGEHSATWTARGHGGHGGECGGSVPVHRAARELRLQPRELEWAVQLGEVRAVEGAAGRHRVPSAELDRLRRRGDLAGLLRQRLRLVGAREGADLLGIGTGRFARLARGGCFGPACFSINRNHGVVWHYLADELLLFARHRPELLSGRAPEGLRRLLDAGADRRAHTWRGRRVAHSLARASDRWERAAIPAAVLDDAVLTETVPDGGERARIRALRPVLATLRPDGPSGRQLARELLTARESEEIHWYRTSLMRALHAARRADRAPRPVGRGSAAHRTAATGRPGQRVRLRQCQCCSFRNNPSCMTETSNRPPRS